ncbi:hypothetical protein FRB90_011192, partial [Tulasnella sp. 427]
MPTTTILHTSTVEAPKTAGSSFGVGTKNHSTASLSQKSTTTTPEVLSLVGSGLPTPQVKNESVDIPMANLSKRVSPTGLESTSVAEEAPQMSTLQEKMYLGALCYCLFVAGWNDGTIGPLLPRIQDYYNIGYTVVSILFVTGCMGVLCGATCNVYLSDKLGFGKLITAAAALQILTYAAMSPAPPFGVLCFIYFVNGFALSLQ